MQRGGDPIILCFVDFVNPECAATAMSALQGDDFVFLSIYSETDARGWRLSQCNNVGCYSTLHFCKWVCVCKTYLINIFFWLCTNLHIPITKLVLKKFLHENDMYHGFAFFLLPVDGLGGAFQHPSCHNKIWNCK